MPDALERNTSDVEDDGAFQNQLELHLTAMNAALNTDGANLINSGASDPIATKAGIGFGFRSKICRYVDFGGVYEHTVVSPEGAFEQRVTTNVANCFKNGDVLHKPSEG